MMTRLTQLFAGLLMTFLLAGCGPDEVEVAVKDRGPEVAGRTLAASLSGTDPAPKGGQCLVFLTVYDSSGGHLQDDQKLRLFGPTNQEGDFRIRPIGNPNPTVPPHEWVFADFDVVKMNAAGTLFQSLVQVHGGPHPVQFPHIFDIKMWFDEVTGCPSKLRLETKDHKDPAGGDDHGGHAFAN